MTSTATPWWKTATGYQIYPRSFCDSDGDGIGDLPGVISRLDHLAELGIGFVWLSPVYASPMHDNGYDISDYRDIAPEFGTLDDFDRLLEEAGRRGIRVVMDLVVNHCSSDHAWFRTALEDPDSPEHDYFYWRAPGPDGGPPDDQRACFGGPAWVWAQEVGKYYYAHFSPWQPDLNWQNPALRRQIHDMMNWWLDKGLGGFRMDVIELIGKDLDARVYQEGPDLHRFLREMHDACLAGRDILTVGETWAATPQSALDYCGAERRELDMVFNFNHVTAAWDPEKGRFGPNLFDLVTHKSIMNDWQTGLAEDGWNALYMSNHDLPRPVSHYADDGEHRVRSAKMLAALTHLMKGTPFVYQGEEIGMTNVAFDRIDQFRDIETLGQWQEQQARGVAVADFIAGANANGRDNARTPMQWDDGPQAGFTAGTPWIDVNPNHREINVTRDRTDPEGVMAFYKALIAMRRTHPILTEGGFELLLPDHRQIFAYLRSLADDRLAVVANVSDMPATLPRGTLPDCDWQLALTNVSATAAPDLRGAKEASLAPWFVGVWTG